MSPLGYPKFTQVVSMEVTLLNQICFLPKPFCGFQIRTKDYERTQDDMFLCQNLIPTEL